MKSVVILSLLLAVLVAVGSKGAERVASADKLSRDIPKARTDDAGALSPYKLAYFYLTMQEILNGSLGSTYKTLRRVLKKGENSNIEIDYYVRFPDGTMHTIHLVSFAELELLIMRLRKRVSTYGDAIEHLSVQPSNGVYQAQVDPICSDGWFRSGIVSIEADAQSFRLSQGDKVFMGTVVGNTMTIIFPGGYNPPLGGTFSGEKAALFDATTGCTVRLRPND